MLINPFILGSGGGPVPPLEVPYLTNYATTNNYATLTQTGTNGSWVMEAVGKGGPGASWWMSTYIGTNIFALSNDVYIEYKLISSLGVLPIFMSISGLSNGTASENAYPGANTNGMGGFIGQAGGSMYPNFEIYFGGSMVASGGSYAIVGDVITLRAIALGGTTILEVSKNGVPQVNYNTNAFAGNKRFVLAHGQSNIQLNNSATLQYPVTGSTYLL